MFRGTNIENQNLLISCLQVVDDTIFFGDANLQNILTLESILKCFEIAYGLKVNSLHIFRITSWANPRALVTY